MKKIYEVKCYSFTEENIRFEWIAMRFEKLENALKYVNYKKEKTPEYATDYEVKEYELDDFFAEHCL